MKPILVILIALLSATGFSQNPDSLLTAYEKAKKDGISDSIELDLLYDAIKVLRYIKPDTSIVLANEGLEHSLKLGQEFFLGAFHESLGDIYWHKGEMQRSIGAYQDCYDIYKESGDVVRSGYALANIGFVYMDLNRYEEALDYYLRSLELARSQENDQLKIVTLTYIGTLQDHLERHDKALEAYQEALVYFEKEGNKRNIAILLTNIASIHMNRKKMSLAEEHFQKAIKIAKEIDDQKLLANALMSLGTMHIEMNEDEKGLLSLLQSADIYSELDSKSQLATAYSGISRALIRLGRYSEVNTYLENGESIAREHEDLESLSLLLKNKADYYESIHRPDDALEALREYVIIKDSVLSVESAKQISALTAAYQSEQKELELENLKKKEALQDAELENEREESRRLELQKYMFAGGFALMLALAFFVLRGYRLKKKANQSLQEKNNLISSQKEEVENQKIIVEEQNKEILDSINYARRLQQAILPSREKINSSVSDSFVYYRPKSIVAGDFYFCETTNDHTYIAAADCTGHGVPGAMVSVVCSNALNKAIIEEKIEHPGDILDRARDLVIDYFRRSNNQAEIKDGMDIALVKIGTTPNDFAPQSFPVEYAGANNNLLIYRDRNAVPTVYLPKQPAEENEPYQIIEIKADKQPIGQYTHSRPFNNHKIDLYPGDTLYLMSDGYADQFGGSAIGGKKFKTSNLKKLLRSIQGQSLTEQEQKLDITFKDWMGDMEQVDDVCIIGIRV